MIRPPQLNLFAPCLAGVILIIIPLLFVRPVERAFPTQIPPAMYPDCEFHDPYWHRLEMERAKTRKKDKR